MKSHSETNLGGNSVIFFFVLGVMFAVLTVPAKARGEEDDDVNAGGARGTPGQGQQRRSPEALIALNNLRQEHGEAWRVRWNNETGLVRLLFGGKTQPFPGNASAAATRFLKDNLSVFFSHGTEKNADPFNWAAAKTRNTPAGTIVTFQQTVRGLKVVKGLVDVLVDTKGGIIHVTSTAAKITDIEPTPLLTSEEALASLRRTLRADEVTTVLQAPELVIWSQGGGRLAYDIQLSQGQSWDVWRHYVDANSGDLLESQRLVLDDRPETGSGKEATRGSTGDESGASLDHVSRSPLKKGKQVHRGSNKRLRSRRDMGSKQR